MRKEPVLTGGQKANRYMSLICIAIILILFFAWRDRYPVVLIKSMAADSNKPTPFHGTHLIPVEVTILSYHATDNKDDTWNLVLFQNRKGV
jgi:hypothetical protein